MARPPSPRTHYDLEVARLTMIVKAVDADEVRGSEWKEKVLNLLRGARELLAQAPPSEAKSPENGRGKARVRA